MYFYFRTGKQFILLTAIQQKRTIHIGVSIRADELLIFIITTEKKQEQSRDCFLQCNNNMRGKKNKQTAKKDNKPRNIAIIRNECASLKNICGNLFLPLVKSLIFIPYLIIRLESASAAFGLLLDVFWTLWQMLMCIYQQYNDRERWKKQVTSYIISVILTSCSLFQLTEPRKHKRRKRIRKTTFFSSSYHYYRIVCPVRLIFVRVGRKLVHAQQQEKKK